MDSDNIKVNEFQTPIADLNIDKEPLEIQDAFWDFFYNVPYIQSLVSPERKRAKDLPKDEQGRIIVDITHPHILEDMDYFRQTALHYKKTGKYTDLRPNGNPNSEYGRWCLEEVRRCWEGMVRPSDGEWIPGDLYFFWNYCPMQLIEKDSKTSKKGNRVLDFPQVWEGHYYKAHYLEQARNNGNHALELAARSKGKAHPYSQIVYTPNGIKTWGDIKIGDLLFGDDGKYTKVIDIPFDEETDIYEVTLSDGRKLQCSLGHLFKVRDRRKKQSIRIASLEEILNTDYAHLRKNGKIENYYSIPNNQAVEFEERKVLIQPYALGIMLGDACFRTGYKNVVMFSGMEEDIKEYRRHCEYDIYRIGTKYSYRVAINRIQEKLIVYGLEGCGSSEKFIPKDYLFNSSQCRLELLRGLLDTDGTVNDNGVPMITTTSERLCKDIIWLCHSLGFNTCMFEKQGKYGDKICKKNYNITILADESVFHLKRKKSKVTKYKSEYSRSRKDWTHIANIKFSHREKAKCVTVDNDSHCYLIGDFVVTHNSFWGAAMLAKRFILGESYKVKKKVTCYATAAEKKFLVAGDQTLDKFQFDIDFIADNTDFPHNRLVNTLLNMQWTMGYVDNDTGIKKGTLNSVVGVTAKDDESKLRGTRAVLYIIEESGTFPRLLQLWNNLRPSVEYGDDTSGILYGYGTSGDSDSDFRAMAEMMYNPSGYKVYSVSNVYDLEGRGGNVFTYFFPGYLNLANYYDENGNSDVTGALMYILKDRHHVKYNTTDINAIIKRTAEIPIVPQEAILQSRGNMFPVAEINERIAELDGNPHSFDDVYVGKMVQKSNGEVDFEITSDTPIHMFPLKDNKVKGALEIFKMPEKGANGKVFSNRYIVGHDPVDNDVSDTMSLSSTFVFDLFTDSIVAEYTGRSDLAVESYEMVRRLCIFYNAQCLYENNIHGLYGYMMQMRCGYLLADTPEYLKEKDLVKNIGVGNGAKGVRATLPVNNHANDLIREWLLSSKTVFEDDKEYTVHNVALIKNRALLQELSQYNPKINVDRIRALGMVMILREHYRILYQGDVQGNQKPKKTILDDPFFKRNSPFRHDDDNEKGVFRPI